MLGSLLADTRALGAHADDEHVLLEFRPGRMALLGSLMAELLSAAPIPPEMTGVR
jgi:hypothetical protein